MGSIDHISAKASGPSACFLDAFLSPADTWCCVLFFPAYWIACRIAHWIACSIAHRIAYRIAYGIAYWIWMPWGRLLDVIFMLSGHLLGSFWTPFGCLWDAFSSPGHPWEPFWRLSENCTFFDDFRTSTPPLPWDVVLMSFWYFCKLSGSLVLHVFSTP